MTSPPAKTRFPATDPFGRKRSGANPLDLGLAFGGNVVADAVHGPASFIGREQLRSGLKDIVAFCMAKVHPNYDETHKGPWLTQGLEIAKGSDFGFDPVRFYDAEPSCLGKAADDPFQGRYCTHAMKLLGESTFWGGVQVLGGAGRGVDQEAFEKWWEAACAASSYDNPQWAVPEFEHLAGWLNRSIFDRDERHRAQVGEVMVDGVAWDGTRVVLDVEGQRIMLAPRPKGRLLWGLMVRTGTVEGKLPVQEQQGPVPILSEMRVRGLGVVCDRLEYLYELQADDPDEPPILFESLKLLSRFLLANPRLATDRLGVDSTGCLTATWILRREVDKGPVEDEDLGSDSRSYWGNGDGILVMVFQPTGSVRFAANSGPPVDGFERLRCNGILPAESVLSAVSEFICWWTSA